TTIRRNLRIFLYISANKINLKYFMKNAAFSLEEFIFNQVWIDLERKISNDIKISIEPNGTFYKEDSVYELVINFKSYNEQIENHFISIQCKSIFNFEEETNFEEIPDYFYTNC